MASSTSEENTVWRCSAARLCSETRRCSAKACFSAAASWPACARRSARMRSFSVRQTGAFVLRLPPKATHEQRRSRNAGPREAEGPAPLGQGLIRLRGKPLPHGGDLFLDTGSRRRLRVQRIAKDQVVQAAELNFQRLGQVEALRSDRSRRARSSSARRHRLFSVQTITTTASPAAARQAEARMPKRGFIRSDGQRTAGSERSERSRATFARCS